MKKILLFFTAIVTAITFTNSGCKKHKNDPVNTTCGCSAAEIQYQIKNLSGTLAFHTHTNKWYIFYQPTSGYFNNNFICNLTQDSVRSIIANASQSATFNVTFSGKVKSVCPNEGFGVQQGNGTNYYVIIDSLKRN